MQPEMNYEDLMDIDLDQYNDEDEYVTIKNKGVVEERTVGAVRLIRARREGRSAPVQKRRQNPQVSGHSVSVIIFFPPQPAATGR